jgi:prepilin-type N-terminal cleavage/methylation domain-containing protein
MNILINNQQSARGFSLTEVLLAVGILAVGMLFIASAFPVGVYFTTVATERTIAPIVADEAFAKLQTLWPVIGPNFPYGIGVTESAYPSTPTTDLASKKYWWSLLYGYNPIDPNALDVFVFVFRKAGVSSQYWVRTSDEPSILPADAALLVNPYPTLIYVSVSASPSGRPDELTINDLVPAPADRIDETSFINGGYTIVDAGSGRMYRVLERYYAHSNVIRLDKDWVGTLPVAPGNSWVWVTSPPAIIGPPPTAGGRYPCIGVYQKTVRF